MDASVGNERKISTSVLDAIHEVRLVLTVERFDEAVQFYRGRLGLPVVEERQCAEGSGVILALGPHTTLEPFDASQADFVDQLEVGRRVSGPVRLALSGQDHLQPCTAWWNGQSWEVRRQRSGTWGRRSRRSPPSWLPL